MNSRVEEDSFPTKPSRPGPSVVDVANEICAKARAAKQPCACGKAAVIGGRCRGCDEDHFYGRDTNSHIGVE